MMPLLWMEARCDRMLTDGAAIDGYGVLACHQTGPGGFYRAAASANADTKKAGWHRVKGEWVCPACWAHKLKTQS